MKPCERAQAQLNDYLDGSLGAAQATALHAHLNDCDACDLEYEALRRVREALHRAAPTPGTEEARERVMARFRHAVGAEEAQNVRRTALRPAFLPTWRPLPFGLAAMSAAAVLLLAALSLPRGVEPLPLNEPSAASTALPSEGELDSMASRHAAESAALLSDASVHRDALADADARTIGME